MRITFTEKDILRSRLVEPGWYILRIDAIGQKPSKDGQSTNYPVEAVIVCMAENGSTQDSGVPLDWNFNSKAQGFMVGFFKAFGVDITAGTSVEMKDCVGKQLKAYVARGEFNGNPKNEVKHQYAPVD